MMKKTNFKILPFTLLEVMICIAILASVGVLFAHRSYQALRVAKTNTAKKLLKQNIRHCSRLSRIYQTDWLLILRQENDGIECELISETERKTNWIPKLSIGEVGEEQTITFTSTGVVFPEKIEISDQSTVEEIRLNQTFLLDSCLKGRHGLSWDIVLQKKILHCAQC